MVIQMDGFTHEFTESPIIYVDDPLFAAFNENRTYTFDQSKTDYLKLVVSTRMTLVD